MVSSNPATGLSPVEALRYVVDSQVTFDEPGEIAGPGENLALFIEAVNWTITPGWYTNLTNSNPSIFQFNVGMWPPGNRDDFILPGNWADYVAGSNLTVTDGSLTKWAEVMNSYPSACAGWSGGGYTTVPAGSDVYQNLLQAPTFNQRVEYNMYWMSNLVLPMFYLLSQSSDYTTVFGTFTVTTVQFEIEYQYRPLKAGTWLKEKLSFDSLRAKVPRQG